MGLDRSKGMDGIMQDGPLYILYRTNKIKQRHRGLGLEDLYTIQV
jgi:hypothetical protein